MALHLKITEDLKESSKAKESFKTETLRFLLASLHNREIEKKSRGMAPSLTDEDVIEILIREAKKRKEAQEIYRNGGREDLAKKEAEELKIIESYLPEKLTAQDIEAVVGRVMEKVKPQSQKDFGKIMGEAMKELRGRVEADEVSKIIKEKLNDR